MTGNRLYARNRDGPATFKFIDQVIYDQKISFIWPWCLYCWFAYFRIRG